MRYLFGLLCVCALGVMLVTGCGEEDMPEPECLYNSQCEDGDRCTYDGCTDEGECVYRPVHCDEPCKIELGCDPAAGCLYENIPDGAPCGGFLYCLILGGSGYCLDAQCECLDSPPGD